MTMQNRVPEGVPTGGQYTYGVRAETGVRLGLARDAAAARAAELAAGGYVRAIATAPVADPRTAAARGAWWDNSFASGEYAPDGGYPQMPDDATPSKLAGLSMTGRRRTHRVLYSGSGVTLRMPSATAIKRFSDESDAVTFDVPVSAEIVDPTSGVPEQVSGWVRVSRRSDGLRWDATTLGFGADRGPVIGEAVSAVLEARRPTLALAGATDLLERRRMRRLASGVTATEVDSTWIDSMGYDDTAGTMVMGTATGAAYGYKVPRAVFEQVAKAPSPGAAYNRLVKGAERMGVNRCERCGRFMAASSPVAHSCPAKVAPRVAGLDAHREAARARAARVAAAYSGRQVEVSPASTNPSGAPVHHRHDPQARAVPLDGWLGERLAERQMALAGQQVFGPRGFTMDVAGELGRHASATYVPWAYDDRRGRSNGDSGPVYFAGVSSSDAKGLLAKLPAANLDERQNDAPTVRNMLEVAAANPGVVEVGGYLMGPDRDDERVSVDTAYLFADDVETSQGAQARLVELGLAPLGGANEANQVDSAWVAGRKAWRVWWD